MSLSLFDFASKNMAIFILSGGHQCTHCFCSWRASKYPLFFSYFFMLFGTYFFPLMLLGMELLFFSIARTLFWQMNILSLMIQVLEYLVDEEHVFAQLLVQESAL
jgi:hypothetical protein